MNLPPYRFYQKTARIVNSKQANVVLLHGNILDLFYEENSNKFVNLPDFLIRKIEKTDGIRVVYYKPGNSVSGDFELSKVIAKNVDNTVDVLKRMADIGRQNADSRIVFIIDNADVIFPAGDGDISRLSGPDRDAVMCLSDWISRPDFLASPINVILIAESATKIHHKIRKQPQIVDVNINNPSFEDRKYYLTQNKERILKLPEEEIDKIAAKTAGISIYALRQLVMDSSYDKSFDQPIVISDEQIETKISEYIRAEIGEDTVEFYQPKHGLADVIGASAIKKFLGEYFIPRVKNGKLSGAIVSGPIGAGKTFIFSAVAGELGIPVLVLKNLRSQWFGQTDVIFEKLKRVLETLDKAMIFVDEADTQGFGIGKDSHETERRLAGKMQSMMSDPALLGKIVWLLLTARPQLLNPDIRRPGRAGDLIIPVLDPKEDDLKEFVRWMAKPFMEPEEVEKNFEELEKITTKFSAASFSSLRNEAKDIGIKGWEAFRDLLLDSLPGDLESERQKQICYALLNTTKFSLLPKEFQDRNRIEEFRNQWRETVGLG